jgi:Glycosyl hydrolase-like 10
VEGEVDLEIDFSFILKSSAIFTTIAIFTMRSTLHRNLTAPLVEKSLHKWYQRLLLGACTTGISIGQGYYYPQPSQAQNADYCQIPPAEVSAKNVLRLATQKGDRDSQSRYSEIVKKHVSYVQQCRQKSWLKNQSIWIRLYPCDTRPGALEEIFDRMVNRGYNQVYVATFYAGRVLLPRTGNTTAWTSVLTSKGTEKTDLLGDAIQKGHERGLKVYSWMYSLSFGPDYGMSPTGQSAVAVNGRGETTLFAGEEGFQKAADGEAGSVLFVDPYSDKAREDYDRMVREVVRRKPDGVLFDYIRFPRGQGPQSIASYVKDLWIYGDESRQTLAALAQNSKGTDLIQRYLDKGMITINDLKEVDKLYPNEVSPLWQGRTPLEGEATMTYDEKFPWIEWDLWQLTLAHASQGVVSFLQKAVAPVEQQRIKTGAVFFPEANQPVGKRGYDSRLQAWDRFPASSEWHPMSYATCNKSNCIVDQVKRVVSMAPAGTQVIPTLAGTWNKPLEGRPSLEEQMDGIHRSVPQINSISHFAFSWQEPELDYYRSGCQLK